MMQSIVNQSAQGKQPYTISGHFGPKQNFLLDCRTQHVYNAIASLLLLKMCRFCFEKSKYHFKIFSSCLTAVWSTRKGENQVLFKGYAQFPSTFQGKFCFQGLFKSALHFQVLFKPVRTLCDCTGWFVSDPVRTSHCWFSHEAAHLNFRA